jgi:uncharacterized protein YheU (UPF0270 family)
LSSDEQARGLAIPAEQLSPDALLGLIEEFITREGTDYGEMEWSLEQKVEQVRAQLRRGDAVIVFDIAAESCTIMPREQASEWLGEG